ncbi:ADC synthase [Fusarium flagelliforme]|uniref:aminodeoxychorismate synthase n=1 Tax=Fusarium flagelliforme TaxID=2675880 RepID=A0A395N5Q8_9HYPO|nr:ADC synthase [Fusarium flagelliforme]KAH7192276.1 ADC synthase [Fusarium flagelliforme]RFN55452.1 aminodeoxychorismate synthase [Fusarium flagelliforme]
MTVGPEPSAKVPKRILFIDAYDSFTNNIVSLLRTLLGADIFVIRIDLSVVDRLDENDAPAKWTEQEFLNNLSQFDAVVCGPGPGSPLNPEDVGAFNLLWDLPEHCQLPVLGICLGFQSLLGAHGGVVRRLKRGLHGMVREIEHQGEDIFRGVPSFKATLYHSLCVDIGQYSDGWKEENRWKPTSEFAPLAWATEIRDDGRREQILQGVRHLRKPFWGLQYHPESVCTEKNAQGVIINWFQAALQWSRYHGRQVQGPLLEIQTLSPPNHLESAAAHKERLSGEWWSASHVETGSLRDFAKAAEYTHREISLPQGAGVPEIVEALGLAEGESVILDSSSSKNGDALALNSIIALDVEQALRVEYNVSNDYVTVRLPGKAGNKDETETVSLEDGAVKVWDIISDFWEKRSYPSGFDQSRSTFKGGFMGFVTYEMGLHGLEKKMVPDNRGHERPDICLAWVTKSVVLDHRAGVAYVQNLRPRGSDDQWLERMTENIQRCLSQRASKGINSINGHINGSSVQHKRVNITTPQPDRYEEQVRVCQDFIAAGESYELCLTSQTTMERPYSRNNENTPWHIYQTLRNRQPAPFGSFIRLGGATMLSCSPERFLRHDSNGLCSMRPMKGTVRKSEAVSTVAQAEKILHVPKEVAENLMIVDLVRHDLHGVCGVGHVTVPDLMKVEEYATVFQMITVVNGQLPGRNGHKPHGARRSSFDSHCPYTGLDALAAALPPGSMTGAPKKRSCELLQVIEGHHERSLYSGVVGYMDVTGAGDWSVTIRTMFRWDDEEAPAQEDETEPREVWRIGAGGAVTILSTPEGERDEMFTKLAGPMGVFRDAA